ncbi:malate:quinone oxidoreductase, partial [Pseudomonas syringae pv. tomato]|nr:malate:quinone oxidoreductase [Pseudomonas syringae pv. tomato]
QIVPSYGTKLNNNPDRVAEEWAYTAEVLQLTPPPPVNKTGTAPTPAAQPAKSNPASDMAL